MVLVVITMMIIFLFIKDFIFKGNMSAMVKIFIMILVVLNMKVAFFMVIDLVMDNYLIRSMNCFMKVIGITMNQLNQNVLRLKEHRVILLFIGD